jgi:hypothetical protein
LREKLRLRVFESRVLRRIFGTKRKEVTGKWRKPHSKLRRMKWAAHAALMHLWGEEKHVQGFDR